ncbi:hypothetical protein Tco_0539587 [Tanacetum coccineum]
MVTYLRAPLTPLVKPGGGIHPIAVGTVWRRLVSKERILELKQRYFKDYCSDNQYAVSIKEDMGVAVPCTHQRLSETSPYAVSLKKARPYFSIWE